MSDPGFELDPFEMDPAVAEAILREYGALVDPDPAADLVEPVTEAERQIVLRAARRIFPGGVEGVIEDMGYPRAWAAMLTPWLPMLADNLARDLRQEETRALMPLRLATAARVLAEESGIDPRVIAAAMLTPDPVDGDGADDGTEQEGHAGGAQAAPEGPPEPEPSRPANVDDLAANGHA